MGLLLRLPRQARVQPVRLLVHGTPSWLIPLASTWPTCSPPVPSRSRSTRLRPLPSIRVRLLRSQAHGRSSSLTVRARSTSHFPAPTLVLAWWQLPERSSLALHSRQPRLSLLVRWPTSDRPRRTSALCSPRRQA